MSERGIENLPSGFLLSGNMTVANEYGSEGFLVRYPRDLLECILFSPYGRNRESFLRSRGIYIRSISFDEHNFARRTECSYTDGK